MSQVEENLASLGLRLARPAPPVANYVGAVRAGRLVFVSGHGPWRDGEFHFKGKVGQDLDVRAAREAAQLVTLNCLASLKAEIGDLDQIERVVKLLGMVNCTPDFTEQPYVIDGASDLLTAIFGERGRHSRSAVGMVSLPLNISVEIEMIVEMKPTL